jgi:hypothetical protein
MLIRVHSPVSHNTHDGAKTDVPVDKTDIPVDCPGPTEEEKVTECLELILPRRMLTKKSSNIDLVR